MNTTLNNISKAVMSAALLLLAFSIGTSKAGIHLGSLLIFITFLVNFKATYNEMPKNIRYVLYSCYGFYIFGAFSSLLLHSTADAIKFLDKNAFLLILPAISYLMMKQNVRKKSVILMIVGVLASCLMSIYNFIFVVHYDMNARALGFMDYSRHINIILLCSGFILSLFIWKKRYLLAGSVFTLSLASIIISGTRGGWLALSIMIIFFLILHFRKYLTHFFIGLICSVSILSIFNNPISNYVLHRFSSITDTSEVSNSVRLTIWQNGIKFINHSLQHTPVDFLFGSGMVSSSESYKNYVYSLPNEVMNTFLLDGELYGSTDFHNAIIDLLIKSGFIYFIFIFSLFVFYFKYCFTTSKRSYTLDSIRLYIFGLISIFPFYSLLQDYSMYAITFALAIIISEYNLNKENVNES